MNGGVFYRYCDGTEEPQFVVLQSKISNILQECHDSALAGHYGIERTV